MKTFHAIKADLASGKTTCVQVTRQYLDAIEQQKDLNAFLDVFPERALSQAESVDKKIAAGTSGSLAGMVIAVKDIICIKNARVSCGSRILKDFVSLYDATVIRKLQEADALLIGNAIWTNSQWVHRRRIRPTEE